MRLNATPYVVSTSSGDDALCIFSTEGRVIAYLREEEQHSLTASATAVPLDNEQDLRQFLEYYPAVLYVALDPEPGELVDSPVAVEEFLRWLEN